MGEIHDYSQSGYMCYRDVTLKIATRGNGREFDTFLSLLFNFSHSIHILEFSP